MNPIPTTIDAVLEQIRALGSFATWSGSSILTIEQIKIYCVPGNAQQAKGRLAIWVRGPKAKRPRILLPELVLRAMHFIAEPKRRGRDGRLDPGNFAESVTGKDAKLPGVWNNNEIYLALARRLLGLPDDHADETTERLVEQSRQQWKDNHPDIRTGEGLLNEILLAYVEARSGYDDEKKPRDWVDWCYRTLRNRHGSPTWKSQERAHRADLAAVLHDIHTDPGHADIRDFDIAVFAMLYANGLYMAGKIRESAVTTAVNRLADAAEDGAIDGLEAKIEQQRTATADQFKAMLAKLASGRKRR